MVKESYISFEVAKLAKERGYSSGSYDNYILYKSDYVYDNDPNHPESYKNGEVRISPRFFFSNDESESREFYEIFEMPTQSILQKWLREEKGIDVFANSVRFMGHSEIAFYNYSVKGLTNKWDTKLKTYEEALEKALEEGLKLT